MSRHSRLRLMIVIVTSTCTPLLGAMAQAATVYISDELTVPLRSGPSGQHRILHAGLPSGTSMEILSVNDTAGFTEVRTSGGTEGWIRSQYLVTEPIAKHRLNEALRQADRLQRELAQAKSQASDLASKGREQAQTNAQDQARIEELQQQLTDLQRISAGAVAQNDENRKLLEINQRLQDELDDIAEERNRLADNAENQAILIGAGLILLGLIAGALIKSRPQRSAWS